MDDIQPLAMATRLAESILSWYGPQKVRWHYEDGLVLMGLLSLAESTDDGPMMAGVKNSYDALVHEDGSIGTYRKEDFNLDQINAGRTLFDLYRLFGDERYRLAIERLMDQLRCQPRTKSGNFWHKQMYPWQVWLDGLYMAGPFIARYAATYGNRADFEDIVLQLTTIERKTRDTATGLLYHAWDESRQQLWADPETGCSPHFWGRAMGWYCMALIDVMDYLPKDCGGRDGLINIIRLVAQAVMAYQDEETGLWFQVMDQGGRLGNYRESSASAMFVYFLHKAHRLAYDTSEELVERASAGYRGLVKHQISEDESGRVHLDGICSVAGVGGNPYRDGSFNYYIGEPVVSDDFKGVGAFILASLEIVR